MIRVQNLHKHYGYGDQKIDVLKGLDLTLEEEKLICILGPSGSGKSTFLNILGGIETIDEGRVEILGKELSTMKKKELEAYRRSHLGFVFQFYNLIGDLNVRENIEVGKYLSKNPLEIEKLIDQLGLTEHAYKFPNEISGGQAQRTSIGRAVIKRPELLICDEPTGALDYESAKEVLVLIEKLNTLYHSTVIFATHNTQIAKMCDVILTLHDGRIKAVEENKHKIPAEEVAW